MEPTAPPPQYTSSSASSASATAAASFAGHSASSSSISLRRSPSTALLGASTAKSHINSSHRRSSSLYPPPMHGRAASLGAPSFSGSGSSSSSLAGGSRVPRATVALYDELCSIRRKSSEHLAQTDAMAEGYRAASRARQQSHLLHLHGGQHQARPSSSSGLPPLPGGAFFQHHAPSFTTAAGVPPLTPRGGFSGGYTPTSPWQQQLAWPSLASSGVRLDLPNGSVSGYAPPWSQMPSFTRAGQPDLPSGTFSPAPSLSQQQLHEPSSCVQPSEGSFFGNASLLHQQQQQQGSSSMASSFAAFAQPSPSWASSGRLQPPERIDIDEEISAGIDGLMRSLLDEPSSGLDDPDLLEPSSSGDRQLQMGSISGRGKDKMPWPSHSSSMESSSTVPKLMLGGMEKRRVLPPSPAVGASSSGTSRNGTTGGDLFTDAEMAKIQKDERLKQLVDTNPKRVKNILSNRASSARVKARKENGVRDLERHFQALQIENVYLSSAVSSEQVKLVELKAQNDQMRMRLQQLEMKSKMNEAQTQALRAEIDSLKHIDLTGLYSTGVPNPMRTPIEDEISWYPNAQQFPGP